MFLPHNEYIHQDTEKNQICTHHTVSNPVSGAKGVWNWWTTDKGKKRIATTYVIDIDGKIFLFIPFNFWGHHLGIKDPRNTKLNQGCIGIEFVSWGGLVEKQGQLYIAGAWKHGGFQAGGLRVDRKTAIELEKPYRNFKFYQRYTDAQLESFRKLALYLNKKHQKITLDYNADMWDVSERALNGESGIWTHNSYRADKADCYPDEKMITILKNF
ncbi:N-acetylmuramoyl-L-alanine amidase [Bernardetia sp.]|uniref:peptidoglycan recognition protein family protein n=1 Tax=Bernardetia sp. TaxID=1937974 RepID=UPI0025C6172A|nr:N-acetylmuramoyl-L-alanine amidase [Bernardetia sp.]